MTASLIFVLISNFGSTRESQTCPLTNPMGCPAFGGQPPASPCQHPLTSTQLEGRVMFPTPLPALGALLKRPGWWLTPCCCQL